MSFLCGMSDDAVLLDIFRSFPDTAKPLLAYEEALMRGPSPFSVAQRELIAAYVSGLNACNYCYGVHTAIVENLGVEAGLLSELLDNMDGAQLDEPLKPVLTYVRKLTLTPGEITPSDAEAVFAAGWDDHALHDAVSVCALFNFMNRLIDGLGVHADDRYYQASAARLASDGYAGLARRVGEPG